MGKVKIKTLINKQSQPVLSIIIPSYKRQQLLAKRVLEIKMRLKKLNFINYELLTIESGCKKESKKNKKRLKLKKRLYPGIARNLGLKLSKGRYVWFVDDDDEWENENESLVALLSKIQDSNFEIISHSLKKNYNDKEELLKNIVLFKEKQEAFNYVYESNFLKKKNILFRDGLHEDIPFVAESIAKAQTVFYLNKNIYRKKINKNSITAKLSKKRISDYVKSIGLLLKIKSRTIKNLQTAICIQGIGVILYLITKETSKNKTKLIAHLRNIIPQKISSKIKVSYQKTKSNFEAACAIFSKKENFNEIINTLSDIFSSHLSCRDLKSSIFLGPTEVIGCCKRFFYNNKMKGDIILLPASKEIDLKKIEKRKKEIEKQITSGDYGDCLGCPYIRRYDNKYFSKINYISIENFSFCNMKCSYCSPKYYGGREAEYDTRKILTDLIDEKMVGENLHVVFGGGEPTLSKDFREISDLLIKNPNLGKLRILSNSLRYSESLQKNLENENVNIVTSIDAGTDAKFKKIRGRGTISEVFENLKKYSSEEKNSEKITIKYIFTNENFESEEIIQFIQKVKQFNLEKCFFQISCNFKLEVPDEKIAIAFYELAARLFQENIEKVYFDDLIRDRLKPNEILAEKIKNFLKNENLLHPQIVSKESKKNVVLWGKGLQSDWIRKSTVFGKSNGIVAVVENEHELELIPKPEDFICCPAAVQSVPEIYKKILQSSFKEKIKFLIFI